MVMVKRRKKSKLQPAGIRARLFAGSSDQGQLQKAIQIKDKIGKLSAIKKDSELLLEKIGSGREAYKERLIGIIRKTAEEIEQARKEL